MPDWKEFEISNFEGIATSNRTPRKNQCQECKNFDLRSVLGDLKLRSGFARKYIAPASLDYRGKLSSIAWLDFENLYISETNNTGEITIWVAKGTLAGETSLGDYSTPDSRDIILFFSSHQFDGTNWVTKNWDGSTTGKYWLNHTIVTKIAAGGVSGDTILLDCASTGLVGELNNWTIVNITKSPYQAYQVVYSDNSAVSQLRIYITSSDHDWADGDEIVLMRNYIPYDYLIGMYNTTANQVSFHKVLDDLVVGLGSDTNKVGILIGYRKNYLKIADIQHNATSVFSSYYDDLSTTNNLILDTYIPIDIEQYGLDIFVASGSSGDELAAGKYFFRLTGLLDGYNEILLVEKSIVLDAAKDLNIFPKLKPGALNKRLTSLRLYCATTANADDVTPTNPYFYVQNYVLRSDENYVADRWYINGQGILTLPTPDLYTEIYDGNGNATEIPETDGTTGFSIYPPTATLAVAGTGKTDTTAAAQGSYWLKFTNTAVAVVPLYATMNQSGVFRKGKIYTVTFYAKGDPITAGDKLTLVIDCGFDHTFTERFSFTLTTDWQQFSFTFAALADGSNLFFYANSSFNYGNVAVNAHFGLDGISILENNEGFINTLSLGDEEMTDKLGYNPTFDMVKSWDDAIVTRGRTFLINPYIEKKYINKIVSSHISGAGANMYHIISAERYIDLENFDGNDLIGIEILPNMNFIAFRSNSSQQVDPDTGATREIIYGNGVVSRRSIVNFGDKIVWCGDNDIMVTDGLNTISLTDGTIGEEYRALTNKSDIVAIREEKDNAYRFFTGDTTNRTEYILTKKGWVKRVNGGDSYPVNYITARDGSAWFMDIEGTIYNDTPTASDYFTYTIGGGGITSMVTLWQSIDFDIDLIGEGLVETDFFYIRSMWLDFTNENTLSYIHNISVSLLMDGVSVKTITFDGGLAQTRKKRPIPLPILPPARRFSIKIAVASYQPGMFPLYGASLSIHSVGILWKPIKAGRFN